MENNFTKCAACKGEYNSHHTFFQTFSIGGAIGFGGSICQFCLDGATMSDLLDKIIKETSTSNNLNATKIWSEVQPSHAQQFYNTFKTILNIRDEMRLEANPFAKECAQACCDKICNVVIKDKEAYDYWKSVREAIGKL